VTKQPGLFLQESITVKAFLRLAVKMAAAEGEQASADEWENRKANLYKKMNNGELPAEGRNAEGFYHFLTTMEWRDLCRSSARFAGQDWGWVLRPCKAWALAVGEDYDKVCSDQEPASVVVAGGASGRSASEKRKRGRGYGDYYEPLKKMLRAFSDDDWELWKKAGFDGRPKLVRSEWRKSEACTEDDIFLPGDPAALKNGMQAAWDEVSRERMSPKRL
jgi:hypothetical protein